jgi:hypothetical protein
MVDYEAVLADLEAKRKALNARFDAAEAAIRQVLAMEVQPVFPSMTGANIVRNSLTERPYMGLTMVDAAVKHLSLHPGPIPNTQLARALEQGGFEHKSKDFPNTLNSVLRRRAMAVGDLRKEAKGWALTKKAVSLRHSDLTTADEP